MAYWLVSNFTSLCFSSVESQIGASLVTMRWRGLELDEAELRTSIKVQLREKLLDLERAIPQDLMANQCNKCQQLVTFLLREFRGYLSNISLGCIQLTLFFSNREDFQRGRSSEAISKIQKFLDGLLLTDRVNEARFKVTVLEKGDEVADPMDTTIYSRLWPWSKNPIFKQIYKLVFFCFFSSML